MPNPRPTRLPLGRTARRLSFERRFKLWLAALALPALGLTAALAHEMQAAPLTVCTVVGALGFGWLVVASLFYEQTMRPLQTLSNVVAALREDDFSFRARGARRGDALGDLAFEINTLAASMERQRIAALDALALVERVLASMQSPVLAFDADARLRLHNAAATGAFALPARPLGLPASELGLDGLLGLPDRAIYPEGPTRWSVRRATFRLQGLPHTLLVLTDIAAALREEERLAFQRLIRVLSHEINNSLTPIQSIAGSLQTRLLKDLSPGSTQDLRRGLAIIEERATALNRFLQSYQRLARLPAPTLRPVALQPFLAEVALLETRVPVRVEPGPPVTLLCDPDQLTQALINLLANAAEAALANPERSPEVLLGWTADAAALTIAIRDSGLGLLSSANLFVPFYTTKLNGSGIGLALVQQIATAHGGSVALTANEGSPGCTASLTLPLSL